MEPVSCVVSLLLLVEAVLGEPKPKAQGQYQGQAQFAGAPAVPLQFAQTKQQQFLQPQFVAAQPAAPGIFEGQGFFAPQFVSQAAQPIQQVILPSNVDRQIQRVAQQAGPTYAQQVQAVQQQAQTQEALAAAQRKATSTTFNNRPIQPIPVPQQPPQPQIVSENRPRPRQQYYNPPASTQGFRPAPPAPQSQPLQRLAAESAENTEEIDDNPNYQFGFDVKDDLNTNYQNRKEQKDGDKIIGSYSVVDADGFIRTVKYTADPKEGFKAEVIRQPTDIVVKSPKDIERQQQARFNAQVSAEVQQQQQQPQYYE